MANDRKRKKGRKRRKREAGAYDPIRGARLKKGATSALASEPLPAPSEPPADRDDEALAREGDEDGLRILAALETMESLEPDFCDDPGDEAFVTIVERVPPFEVEAPGTPIGGPSGAGRDPDSQRVRPGCGGVGAFFGPVEEAVVEIFEGPPPDAPGPHGKRGKAQAVTQRHTKTPTADGDS